MALERCKPLFVRLAVGEHQPTHLAYPATDVAHTASHATRHCTATFQSCQNCLPFQDHTFLQHLSMKSPCLVAPEILNLKLIHCRFTFFLFSRKFSYPQWFRGLSFCRVYLFRFLNFLKTPDTILLKNFFSKIQFHAQPALFSVGLIRSLIRLVKLHPLGIRLHT